VRPSASLDDWEAASGEGFNLVIARRSQLAPIREVRPSHPWKDEWSPAAQVRGAPAGRSARVRRWADPAPTTSHWHNRYVAARDIDSYLAGVSEPKRSTLERLRRCVLDVLPDAEECISYGMPAFKVQGKTVAGFAAFKNHLSYLPHSGSVLPTLAADLVGYEATKGSLHFPIDQPLPAALVHKLVTTRLRELGL
jgi:uncharacterized protein YdhG (YjbR/CyaY superfamily)